MKYTITLECDNPTELFEMAARLNGNINVPEAVSGAVDAEKVNAIAETKNAITATKHVAEEITLEVNETKGETSETADEEITPDSTNAETPSIDDVRAAMVAYTKAKSRDDAIELLGQFVPKGEKAVLSNVPEENYGALVAAAS